MTNDRELVTAGPKAYRRLWWRGTASILVACVALLTITMTSNATLELVCAAVLGLIVGLNSHKLLSQARSYRSGWLDGRHELLASMIEAHTRKLAVSEWLDGERERTGYVTGRDIPEGKPE